VGQIGEKAMKGMIEQKKLESKGEAKNEKALSCLKSLTHRSNNKGARPHKPWGLYRLLQI